MTEPKPCPSCDGYGVLVEEPGGWWHGSGVFAREYECRDCDGTGEDRHARHAANALR